MIENRNMNYLSLKHYPGPSILTSWVMGHGSVYDPLVNVLEDYTSSRVMVDIQIFVYLVQIRSMERPS